MKLDFIDDNQDFDFGRVSKGYALYRNIYPKSLYKKLIQFGIGIDNSSCDDNGSDNIVNQQNILDLGSGTAILPINMCSLTTPAQAHFTSTDIAPNQVKEGEKLAEKLNLTNRIDFKVCGAEETPFKDSEFDVVIAVQCFHYFDTSKAVPEIKRILKKNGKLCKVFMDWMPYEDDIVREMESLVLKYNPNWKGHGFKQFKYQFPEWAEDQFEIETIHSFTEYLPFEKEAWLGRILTCRGVGASLSKEEITAFEQEYRHLLEKYPDSILKIKHQIHIEIYKSK